MFATPDISHITSDDIENVYEPAEDSFLFLDALEKDYKEIKERSPLITLEIGSGSGLVSTFLARVLKPSLGLYICTDINKLASELTMKTSKQNNVHLQSLVTDLANGLLPRLENMVDLLLFNPPYVVTPPEEVGSADICASWAGGDRGRQVINRFLPLVPRLLSKNGACYLVIIKENDEDEIERIMANYGLCTTSVLSRRTGLEHLSVLKFTNHPP